MLLTTTLFLHLQILFSSGYPFAFDTVNFYNHVLLSIIQQSRVSLMMKLSKDYIFRANLNILRGRFSFKLTFSWKSEYAAGAVFLFNLLFTANDWITATATGKILVLSKSKQERKIQISNSKKREEKRRNYYAFFINSIKNLI